MMEHQVKALVDVPTYPIFNIHHFDFIRSEFPRSSLQSTTNRRACTSS
jgi:hypothetical protein